MIPKKNKQRTVQQNRALHKLFQMWADALNDAGKDMRVVLKPEVEIPWSKDSIKNHLWRPIQKVYLGKSSTTELTRGEIDKVYDVVNRHLGKHIETVLFPSFEEIIIQQSYEKRNK